MGNCAFLLELGMYFQDSKQYMLNHSLIPIIFYHSYLVAGPILISYIKGGQRNTCWPVKEFFFFFKVWSISEMHPTLEDLLQYKYLYFCTWSYYHM